MAATLQENGSFSKNRRKVKSACAWSAMWRYLRAPFLLLSKPMTSKKPTPAGLYVHIPFCKTKCPYCDFYSIIDQKQQVKRFVSALVREMSSQPEGFSEFDSLYFGGGTPSAL